MYPMVGEGHLHALCVHRPAQNNFLMTKGDIALCYFRLGDQRAADAPWGVPENRINVMQQIVHGRYMSWFLCHDDEIVEVNIH